MPDVLQPPTFRAQIDKLRADYEAAVSSGSQLRDTYLILFRNTGDGWKAFREVASSSPPPGGWPTD